MRRVQIDEKILEKYFNYGIANKSELEEGLLFYTASKMHKNEKGYKVISENKDVELYSEMNEEERKKFFREYREEECFENQILRFFYTRDLIESALPIFKQYYRFIILPDDKRSYTLDISNDKENFIKENIRMKVEDMQRQGKLIAYPVGVFFTREQEQIFIEREWPKNINTLEMGHYKHWTQEIFEVLEELIKLEWTSPQTYQEKWIDVRLKRAKNRENGQDVVEIANIEKLKKIFESKKLHYMNEKDNGER